MVDKEKITSGLSWISLAAKALSFLQAMLPAFFVAWNNSLTRKNKELEGRLEHSQLKHRARDREDEIKNRDSSSTAIIDSFLDK